jgi:hypothetical protein
LAAPPDIFSRCTLMRVVERQLDAQTSVDRLNERLAP